MGGYVDRLRNEVSAGSGFPTGKAENNCDFSAQIAQLFGPIEIED
jgi:hypothetical protein